MTATQSYSANHELLSCLADGDWHSGESLARFTQLTRAGLWARINALRELGVEIEAERGLGYRLAAPVTILDRELITNQLDTQRKLVVLTDIDSTNRWLQTAEGKDTDICIAEYQQGGRGRRGRQWLSPPATGLLMSLRYQFTAMPDRPGLLSLVIGLAAAEAIEELGVTVDLKWPNDLQVAGSKLGGVLVELAGDPNGQVNVIVGMGLNISATPANADQSVVDLHSLIGGSRIDRNALAAACINRIYLRLEQLAHGESSSLIEAWRKRDILYNQTVMIFEDDISSEATAHGIAEDGALLVTAQGEQRKVFAADVSVRSAA